MIPGLPNDGTGRACSEEGGVRECLMTCMGCVRVFANSIGTGKTEVAFDFALDIEWLDAHECSHETSKRCRSKYI